MSDDWKKGDMALCIGAHPMYPPEVQPGSFHTVEMVWRGIPCSDDLTIFDMAFDLVGIARVPPDNCYWHGHFVKVTPGHEVEGKEVEHEKFKQGNPWKVPA